jgi:hypothetical protein
LESRPPCGFLRTATVGGPNQKKAYLSAYRGLPCTNQLHVFDSIDAPLLKLVYKIIEIGILKFAYPAFTDYYRRNSQTSLTGLRLCRQPVLTIWVLPAGWRHRNKG